MAKSKIVWSHRVKIRLYEILDSTTTWRTKLPGPDSLLDFPVLRRVKLTNYTDGPTDCLKTGMKSRKIAYLTKFPDGYPDIKPNPVSYQTDSRYVL